MLDVVKSHFAECMAILENVASIAR
jgi:hypothetical protein